MPEIKPALDTFAKIMVVGVGGAGGSAVNRMVEAKIRGVEFVVVNTDIQALHSSLAPHKINIGKTVTRGLGAGMDPDTGRRAAEESQNEIREALKGANMVFVTCGLGGGTGSGASPIVADIARELGALTVAVVTKPFAFEGTQRRAVADRAHEDLAQRVDTIITIPNDRVLEIIDKKTTRAEAFRMIDDVLRQAVQGIADLIMTHGDINVDFADVRRIMANQGPALMGIGRASGDNRAIDAAKLAISSPLLELSIDGARGILFIVTGPSDIGMQEIQEAAKVVTGSADENATIIWGLVHDESMNGEVKITVVATGFEDRRVARNQERDRNDRDRDTAREEQPFRPISRPVFRQQPVFAGGAGANASNDTPPAMATTTTTTATAARRKDDDIPGFKARPIGVATLNKMDDTMDDVDVDEVEIPAFIRKKMGGGA